MTNSHHFLAHVSKEKTEENSNVVYAPISSPFLSNGIYYILRILPYK